MAQKDTAFIIVSCKCPICEHDSRHRYLKSKLFKVGEIEDDQHVIDYHWEDSRFEGIRPNFYHIWHCRNCQFCDEKEPFRGEDSSGGKLELIREKVLIGAKAPSSVLARLGKWIDLEREHVSLESALSAHLLAIHVQLLLSPNRRQHAKLGRLYLRLAWLYREKETWSLPEVGIPDGFQNFGEFFDSFRQDWEEIPLSENAAMGAAVEGFKKDLDQAGNITDIRHEIGTMFLITVLMLRMGNRNEGLQYLQTIFQRATQKRQDSRKALEAGIQRGKLNAKQIDAMGNLVKWLNANIERAKDLAGEVQDKIFADEYPSAREKVLELESPTLKEIVGFLKENGFHPVTQKRIATMFQNRKLQVEADASENADDSAPKEEPKKTSFWSSIMDKFSGDDK